MHVHKALSMPAHIAGRKALGHLTGVIGLAPLRVQPNSVAPCKGKEAQGGEGGGLKGLHALIMPCCRGERIILMLRPVVENR